MTQLSHSLFLFSFKPNFFCIHYLLRSEVGLIFVVTKRVLDLEFFCPFLPEIALPPFGPEFRGPKIFGNPKVFLNFSDKIFFYDFEFVIRYFGGNNVFLANIFGKHFWQTFLSIFAKDSLTLCFSPNPNPRKFLFL